MGFEQCHPAAGLVYFSFAVYFAAAFDRPAWCAVAFICSFLYLVKLKGKRGVVIGASVAALAALFAALYASFEHFGVTVLRVNAIGNSITLEAILCGAARGVSLGAAAMWLACFFTVFTKDKTVFLLGGVSPRLSMFAAGLFRAAPRIAGESRRIKEARRCIGMGPRDGNIFSRVRNRVSAFSALVTRTVDSFGEISDSAKCRGSALRGRSAYPLCRFDNRDRAAVIVTSALVSASIAASLLGHTRAIYDPEFFTLPMTPAAYVFFACYAAFCLLPTALDLYAEYRFRRAVKSVRDGAK